MTSPKRVLLIGLRSDVVDYSKYPGLTQERLEGALQQVAVELRQLGHDAAWCLTDLGETAEDVLRQALLGQRFDCLLVGAGVRLDAELTPLLETIINVLRVEAPATPIAFNTKPFDTVAAVQRLI